MNKFLTAFILITLFLTSCENGEAKKTIVIVEEENPAAEGFNTLASDAKAVVIADKTMTAMGGRKRYDNLRYIAWNFFGARNLVWDKQTGRVRIDVPSRKTTYLVNINTLEGKVLKNGMEVTDPDSLATHVEQAKNIWINDSYWLVMPFKLKDSGVTLKYSREDTTQGGTKAFVLTLTFDSVGVTPNNRYEVYIDKSDHLVKQWAYFQEVNQETASAIWPWDNYTNHNDVLFSGDRSDGKGPRNVQVYDSLPDEVFTSFDEPELK